MNKTYAGVGARVAPEGVLAAMRRIAARLEKCGWFLRTGGAEGPDTAFDEGVEDAGNVAVYLPWKGFDGSGEEFIPIPERAFELAEQYHPNWAACSDGVKKLHARNSMVLLGPNCDDPVDFVIAWTPEGKTVGGTGQVLRMAYAMKIPIFNIAVPNNARLLHLFLETQETQFSIKKPAEQAEIAFA